MKTHRVILVSGARGDIGQAVVKALLGAGHSFVPVSAVLIALAHGATQFVGIARCRRAYRQRHDAHLLAERSLGRESLPRRSIGSGRRAYMEEHTEDYKPDSSAP